MASLLNFRIGVEDLLGPRLTGLLAQAQRFGREVERPHPVTLDSGRYYDSLGKMREANGRFVAGAKSGFASAESGAGGSVAGLGGLLAKLGGAFAVFEGFKGIAKMGADLEQTRIQFETFTGTAAKGNAVLADLQKFAQVTPFEDNQVIAAGRQLLAFGEDAQSLNPILTKLGNISSATGKDFNELVSLYGKNKLSGIIQGEDLNQLNDSGIPVMESLARQLGVTTGQVRKMGAEGKISFSMLNTAFDELGGPAGKWGDLMDKQSKTLAGRWSSLMGFAQNLGGKLGEMLVPFLGKIVDGGNAVLTFVSTNGDKISAMLAPLADAVQPLVAAFSDVFAQFDVGQGSGGLLVAVFNGLATAISYLAPPLKIAAGLLGALIGYQVKVYGAIAKFLETSPRLQKFFAGLWEGAVAVFRGIAEAATKFLGGVGDVIEGVFTGNFGKIKSGLLATLNGLGDAQFDKIGQKAADGFVGGYKKSFQKSTLFDTQAPGAAESSATAFMGGNKKAAGGAGGPGLTAGLKQAAGAGVGGGASRVMNIKLEIREMLNNMKVEVASAGEGAERIGQLIRDTVLAELNDVMTLTSE